MIRCVSQVDMMMYQPVCIRKRPYCPQKTDALSFVQGDALTLSKPVTLIVCVEMKRTCCKLLRRQSISANVASR